jgi:hypothetical protein
MGSIPTEFGELASLAYLDLCTWIGLPCSYECHACSHFLVILFHQIIVNSRVPFRANSENWRRWVYWNSVRGLVCLVGMNVTLALLIFPCHSIWAADNILTGAIPRELGDLTSLTILSLGTCIGLSCSYECHLLTFALPFCLIRSKWFDGRPRSDLLWCILGEFAEFYFWLHFWSCVQLLHLLFLMWTRGPIVPQARIIIDNPHSI